MTFSVQKLVKSPPKVITLRYPPCDSHHCQAETSSSDQNYSCNNVMNSKADYGRSGKTTAKDANGNDLQDMSNEGQKSAVKQKPTILFLPKGRTKNNNRIEKVDEKVAAEKEDDDNDGDDDNDDDVDDASLICNANKQKPDAEGIGMDHDTISKDADVTKSTESKKNGKKKKKKKKKKLKNNSKQVKSSSIVMKDKDKSGKNLKSSSTSKLSLENAESSSLKIASQDCGRYYDYDGMASPLHQIFNSQAHCFPLKSQLSTNWENNCAAVESHLHKLTGNPLKVATDWRGGHSVGGSHLHMLADKPSDMWTSLLSGCRDEGKLLGRRSNRSSNRLCEVRGLKC